MRCVAGPIDRLAVFFFWPFSGSQYVLSAWCAVTFFSVSQAHHVRFFLFACVLYSCPSLPPSLPLSDFVGVSIELWGRVFVGVGILFLLRYLIARIRNG